MTDPAMADARLAQTQAGEGEEMPRIECAKCGQTAELTLFRNPQLAGQRDLEFRGIVTCSGDGHEWPLTVKTDSMIQSIEQMMPVVESSSLLATVPPGLVQDIEAAERAHFAQIYKASVVMCRRAVQLGLNYPPHDIPDGPFARMIEEARAKTPPPLTPRGFIHIEGVKAYGDHGAHQREELSALDARSAIFAAVMVLNELFA